MKYYTFEFTRQPGKSDRVPRRITVLTRETKTPEISKITKEFELVQTLQPERNED